MIQRNFGRFCTLHYTLFGLNVTSNRKITTKMLLVGLMAHIFWLRSEDVVAAGFKRLLSPHS